jgi:hypothetical protein
MSVLNASRTMGIGPLTEVPTDDFSWTGYGATQRQTIAGSGISLPSEDFWW